MRRRVAAFGAQAARTSNSIAYPAWWSRWGEKLGRSRRTRVFNPGNFVAAIGLAPSDPNRIYAAETPRHAEIFVTTDHGATWTEHEIVPLPVRVGDLQVGPIDPDTAYAVIKEFSSMGNAFRTTDGGASWTNISGDLPLISAGCLGIIESIGFDRKMVRPTFANRKGIRAVVRLLYGSKKYTSLSRWLRASSITRWP
jgi:hypothetical protein